MVKYWLTVHLLLVGGDHTRLMDIPEISMAACLTDVAEVSEAFQANLANDPQLKDGGEVIFACSIEYPKTQTD